MNKGLGRIHAPDDRDRKFPMRYPYRPVVTYKYWWDNGVWLDQGNTGTCVGHGWAHEIEDSPVTHPDDVVNPFRIYDRATELDEWPGNEGDRDAGTSVRAGAKAAREFGYIGSFTWAWDIATVVNTLLTVGPVVVGTNWYESMFDPAPVDGRITMKIAGDVVGGHCYVLNGVNTLYRLIRLKNSWGQSWGDMGRAWISFDDVARLIGEDGEACQPLDVRPASG